MVLCLVFLLNESRPELTPRGLLWGGLAITFLLILNGILGMMCTMHPEDAEDPAQQRAAFKCYLVMTTIIAAIIGCGLRWAIVSNKKEVSTKRMSKLWNELTDEKAMAIQAMGECCGFTNYTDRIQEPCIRFTKQVGCAPTMIKYHKKATDKIIKLIYGLLTVCGMAIISGMGMWIWGERKWTAQEQNNRGQGVTEHDSSSNNYNQEDDGPKSAQYDYPHPDPGTPRSQAYHTWHNTVFL